MINIVFIGFNYKYAIIGFEWFWIIPLSLPTLHNAGCISLPERQVFELSSERMILSKSIKASNGASNCWLIMANNG